VNDGPVAADASAHIQGALESHCSKVVALNNALLFFNALSFIGYGAACFLSSRMKREFVRYRLGPQRVWVGLLQWGAGIGLLWGMWVPWLGQAAAGGLALMMLLAVGVRVRIGDSVLQTIPALFYLMLNAYLWRVGFEN
jgi:hypothetical protein